MRHLKEFEEDEIFSDIDDLAELGFDTYSGYVISLITGYSGNMINFGGNLVVIIANSEKQAIETFLADYEDWNGEIEDISSWEDVYYSFEDWHGDSVMFSIENIWRGLKPKTLHNKPSLASIPSANPYYASQELEKIFSNVREIMTKHITGTPEIK